MGGFEGSLLLNAMSARKVNTARRYAARGANRYMGSVRYRLRPSLPVSIGLLIMATFLFVGYLHHASELVASGPRSNIGEDVDNIEGQVFCASEVQRAIPVLRDVYADRLNKVLYVGPDACLVVPELLEEEDFEVWGVEPYGFDASDSLCMDLIRKGIVRVADIKFPLPYREKSFSYVIVSDALEYLSTRNLNTTLPELMRLSSDGVIIFAGYPDFPVSAFTRYSRPAKYRSPSWWKRYLVQRKLEEDVAARKRFKKVSKESSYDPACQIFHLKSGSYYN